MYRGGVTAIAPLEAYLAWYVPQGTRALGQFLTAKRRAAARLPEIREAVERVSAILAGGKKLRGALVQIGFECAGARRRFLPASFAYELMHAFLLIHDDIMDRARVRRGQPTLHERYARQLRRRTAENVAAHLGNAAALTLGDLVFFWALEVFASTSVPSDRLTRALGELGSILEETAHGQLLDLLTDWRDPRGPAAALAIAQRKTARYSVTGPLVVGALLGGGDERLCRALVRFGRPLGVAFQLRDDLLGLYGEEDVMGKSPLSDLREGKPTYLIAAAYRRGTRLERAVLRSLWGKRTAGRRELERVRDIVTRTGATVQTEQFLNRSAARARGAIGSITAREPLRALLRSVTAFLTASATARILQTFLTR